MSFNGIGLKTTGKFQYDKSQITKWIDGFLLDRKAQGLKSGTIHFYRTKLEPFARFIQARNKSLITEISPTDLRAFLLHLEDTGHSPGGILAFYKAIRAFLYWYEDENEEEWRNPIRKVKAPKVPQELLEPVQMEIVKALLETCDKSFTGLRDRAIILSLLDTGARAAIEFLRIDLVDIDVTTGAIIIWQGKGGKPRSVFLGKESRKAVRRYLNQRTDKSPALWVTDEFDRLQYAGLRSMIRRRSKKAGIEPPSLHAFRRAWALEMLRAGVDVYSLQNLGGWADLQIVKRYLKQTEKDLQAAHQKFGPVDRQNF
jgi:integrase/recombinase XerD